MKSFTNSRKFLFGLAVSMVLAMAIGSFALGENQTPVSPQGVEAQNAVGATAGAFTVNGGTQGTDYEFTGTSGTDGVLTIHPQSIGTNITISNSNTEATTDRIEVTSAATITLAGVNINANTGSALQIQDNATFNVNILLADGSNNTLKGKTGSDDMNPGSPGIHKNGEGDNIGMLTIGVPDGSAGTGKLESTGGYEAAGIGAGRNESASNITITGGVVTAYGGNYGAGIGSSWNSDVSNIAITGGEVTATGGQYGAGIGGGYQGSGSYITITGGVVTAYGGNDGAGIGGGARRNGSNITINGGEVTATGGDRGAGIGGGIDRDGSYITINGGAVKATGGRLGAGIGGGARGNGSNITINGGEVTATGGYGATGIGGGYYNNGSNIRITDGVVTATGGYGATGIGGGIGEGRYGGDASNITISGGVVTAYGGHMGAGIGSGWRGSGSGNSLNGDAVVFATSGGVDSAGAMKDALDGFVDDQQESLLTKGIAFTGLGTAFDSDGHATDFSWDESGTMYGSVTLYKDLELLANLTVPAGNTLTLDQGVTLKIPTGKMLKNDGTITANNTGTINCQGTITTKTDFYFDDGSLYDTGYQTYQTNAGVQKYKNLPNPYQLDPSNGKRLINWYYLNQTGQEVAISENVNVLLNEHSFHENSVEQFTVTFSVPTGTAPAAQTIDDGSKATDPQLIWTDGTVEGWYKDQAFTPANKWNFNTDTVTGNITLYARFQYTVTFNVPTGTAPQAQNVDIGGKATDPQFSWTDGTVEGWYKENTYKNKWNFSTDTVTGNITLYAKFTCSVTFNSQGGSTVAGETVVYDNTVQEPDEPTRDDGYSFVEWCKDEECTIAWDFENDRVQGDMTLYAKWIGDEHRVIIPTNPDGHGTVTTDPENPNTGDEVIITVIPEEGYEIDGLPIVKTEDGRIIEVVPTGNPNEYKFIMPNSDVTIEVHFVLISEPTVDPGVKTGDSFAGIAALAIIGLSTTGAVMLRKRK